MADFFQGLPFAVHVVSAEKGKIALEISTTCWKHLESAASAQGRLALDTNQPGQRRLEVGLDDHGVGWLVDSLHHGSRQSGGCSNKLGCNVHR